MKLLDNIFKKFGYGKIAGTIPDGAFANDTADDKEGINIFEASSLGTNKEPPVKKASEYLKEMQGWVYSCVTAIADKVADTEWRLFKYNPEGEVEEQFTHPVLDSLYKINEFSTKFDHLWLTMASLELTGEAPWLVEKNTSGEVVGIYLLRSDRINILFDDSKLISGYEYIVKNRSKMEKIIIPANEIIFLKYSNPNNPYRGLGTLQAAARTVDIDNYSEEWNKRFYFNSARPDGLLTVKVKKLTEEQRKRLKASVREYYQGVDNAHKLLVLSGDMDYKQFGLSQKDMDFLQQQNFSRNKILGIFRVPKALVAQTDDVNYANAKTAERLFTLYTIKPKLQRISEQLNEFFIPLFPDGDNLFLDFKNPIPEEQEDKIRKYQAGLGTNIPYMTINEVRGMENLSPLEGDAGDKIYMPMGTASIGLVSKITKKFHYEKGSNALKSFNARTKIERKFDGLHLTIRKIAKESLKKSKVKIKKTFTLEQKKSFWNSQIKVADSFEKEYKEKLNAFFERQKKQVINSVTLEDGKKALSKENIITKSLLDLSKEQTLGVIIFNPLTKDLVKKEGQLALRLVNEDAFNLDMPAVREFIKNRPKDFIKEITEFSNEKIKDAINLGIEEGEGIDKIKNRISSLFDEFEDYRSERIARSEVIRGSNFATEQAYIQSDVVDQKEWLTSFDKNTCLRCSAMDGKKVDLGENFFDEGDTFMGTELNYGDVEFPPLHPDCRCVLIPFIK